MQVTIHQAKAYFSRLLKQVAAGEEVVIVNGNRPVARLIPIETEKRRMIGEDRGLYEIPDDFDDTLPESVLVGG